MSSIWESGSAHRVIKIRKGPRLKLGGVVHDLGDDFPAGLKITLKFALNNDDASLWSHQKVVGKTGRIRKLDAYSSCAMKDRFDFGNRKYLRCPMDQVSDECLVMMMWFPFGVAGEA